jgi:hypothetical protein
LRCTGTKVRIDRSIGAATFPGLSGFRARPFEPNHERNTP